MGGHNLGIIGRGKATKSLLDYVATSALAQFCEQFSTITFYNHYADLFDSRKEAYEKNPPKDKPSLYPYDRKEFVNNGLFKEQLEQRLPKIGSIEFEPEEDFDTFFTKSDVILDASGGYLPKSLDVMALKMHRKNCPYDLVPHSIDSDWGKYVVDCKERQIPAMTSKEFEKYWNHSAKLLRTFGDRFTNPKQPALGLRLAWVFPFAHQLMHNRANKIHTLINEKGITRMPTYVNIVNEPCLTSNIITAINPEMAAYTVAATDYDWTRLEEIFEKEYRGVLGNAAKMRLTIAGTHDTYTVVPVLEPKTSAHKKAFDKFMKHANNREKVHTFLQRQVGFYFTREPPEIRQLHVSKGILRTLLNASKSRDKALSIYPSLSERPLYNGFLQETELGGMYLIGPTRFRNGRVIGNV
jgi:hypothetical protein